MDEPALMLLDALLILVLLGLAWATLESRDPRRGVVLFIAFGLVLALLLNASVIRRWHLSGLARSLASPPARHAGSGPTDRYDELVAEAMRERHGDGFAFARGDIRDYAAVLEAAAGPAAFHRAPPPYLQNHRGDLRYLYLPRFYGQGRPGRRVGLL